MIFQALLGKDGIYIGQCLESSTTGLVINHTNLIRAIRGGDTVKTVDSATNCRRESIVSNRYLKVYLHWIFESQNGKGGQTTVNFQQLPDIFDDDLAIDDLQSVERRQWAGIILYLEQLALEGFVHSTFNVYSRLE